MKFADQFREKYRVALRAARANDTNGTIAGLSDLYELFAAQYSSDNGDSIVIKAKLSYWQQIFGTYVTIIRQHGLQDRRVQKLFGLIEDNSVPTFSDILRGDPIYPYKDVRPVDGINFDGIVPNEPIVQTPERPEEIPVIPQPPQTDKPIVPVGEPISPRDTTKPEPVVPQVPENEDGNNGESGENGSAGGNGGGSDKPTFEPESLRDFIGQQHIVKALLKEIAIAKAEGRKHLDNILLFGNPGLGKSTLMGLIAKELGVKFELLDCSQFRNSQQSLKALQNFFMRIGRENEPVVIALDEVHMLNNELQSSLLTLLNNRIYISPLDINGQQKVIPIDEFTFIAATTDDNEVLDTIKNRCLRLTFKMVDYTSEELKRIYRNKIAAKGLTIDDDALEICIPRSRGAIRYVNSIVDGLNVALYNDEGQRFSTHITLETALKYFEEKGIDPIGLEKKDLEILRVLSEDITGAMSADVLSARVGLDTKVYLSEHERYLIKIGFINVSGKGRSLTEKAIKYLKGGTEDAQ